MRPQGYRKTMDLSIETLFKGAVALSVQKPSFALYLLETIARQRNAARLRDQWSAKGVLVPPIMIASITDRCNLRCKGCYSRTQHRPPGPEMEAEEWRRVFTEAKDLGISIALLAGGEPLMRREVLDVASSIPEIVFAVFTNGLLLDAAATARLAGARNIVPVLSLEGHESETDDRRGEGVYRSLREAMKRLREAGIFFGVSVTVTSANFETVTAESFARECIHAGCKLFFFVEYVPVREGTEGLVLSDEQKTRLLAAVAAFRGNLPGLFVAFPGDEEEAGGCVAAGRGFVHVSASGDLEPCPFSPYSDANVRTTSLGEALKSRFLAAIRENDDRLARTKGGCALWENRAWVASLLAHASSRSKV